jgi:hypothetical protein
MTGSGMTGIMGLMTRDMGITTSGNVVKVPNGPHRIVIKIGKGVIHGTSCLIVAIMRVGGWRRLGVVGMMGGRLSAEQRIP